MGILSRAGGHYVLATGQGLPWFGVCPPAKQNKYKWKKEERLSRRAVHVDKHQQWKERFRKRSPTPKS